MNEMTRARMIAVLRLSLLVIAMGAVSYTHLRAHET